MIVLIFVLRIIQKITFLSTFSTTKINISSELHSSLLVVGGHLSDSSTYYQSLAGRSIIGPLCKPEDARQLQIEIRSY